MQGRGEFASKTAAYFDVREDLRKEFDEVDCGKDPVIISEDILALYYMLL